MHAQLSARWKNKPHKAQTTIRKKTIRGRQRLSLIVFLPQQLVLKRFDTNALSIDVFWSSVCTGKANNRMPIK
jgi:hypothetical protein